MTQRPLCSFVTEKQLRPCLSQCDEKLLSVTFGNMTFCLPHFKDKVLKGLTDTPFNIRLLCMLLMEADKLSSKVDIDERVFRHYINAIFASIDQSKCWNLAQDNCMKETGLSEDKVAETFNNASKDLYKQLRVSPQLAIESSTVTSSDVVATRTRSHSHSHGSNRSRSNSAGEAKRRRIEDVD